MDRHLAGVAAALLPYRAVAGRLARWGGQLAWTLGQGGRLLVAGNGGSAAEAQHLAAELVGRLRGERVPLSALALCADSSAVTAISNDYGFDEVFARQVRGHGRADDILIVMSTSGRSPNLLAAVDAARDIGMRTWAFTGAGPNPLADLCDEALRCPSDDSQVVQELHLISVHLLCEYVDRTLPAVLGTAAVQPAAKRAHHDVSTALSSGHLVTAGAPHASGVIHPSGNGRGHGDGNGNGNGRGHGDGNGRSHGDGHGHGHGNGRGHGDGASS